ncbi:MAG TPA: carboxylate--amine ligase/circularly permuted type 2 ATP-grasp protein [Propionibacteriaceae bacterium]|nr:carboxylate--amine ligase/circularly permuted type 2 ATP-grasp protein [Propionibacteriaceae bacterium]
MATELTLGVEEELHLIDMSTFRLAGRAPALLAQLSREHFSSELQRTTVEVNTAVCDSLHDLRADLVAHRGELVAVASSEGIGIAAVGTVPLSTAGDFELTSNGRFARMQEDYRLLVDEQLICGTQFHVGIDDRDLAVRVIQRLSRDIPSLLALSASSPLWHGSDTGYASIRSIIWQRWPTAGATGPIGSAAEYDELLSDLIASGVITDAKMAYFDLRPSSHVPTLELRICDAIPLVDDTIMVAGLFRALVADAIAAEKAGDPPSTPALPLQRAAVWRAARSGLTGRLLDHQVHPQPRPAGEVIRSLLARLRPRLEQLGDYHVVSNLLEQCLERGNSADRQRAALAERGRLADVVLQVVAETQDDSSQSPRQSVPHHSGYPTTTGDEAFTPSGAVRPLYREVIKGLESIGSVMLVDRTDERNRWLSGAGMTFGVNTDQRPFQVDLVPRLISAHEWRTLKAGLIQRARTLEMFLQDVYSAGEVVRDGVLPAAAVYECTGWRQEARLLPRGTVHAPIIGFDLVRDESAGWRVLEDNARVPSGVGYAMAARQLMDAVMPDLPRPPDLLPSHTAPALLRRTLSALSAVQNPVMALLSDGAGNSAWFEHRLLAERAGLLLAQPADIEVHGPVVTVLGRRVDVVYLRLDVELADLTAPDGSPIGAQLLQSAARGSVSLANPPGNGVADDKAMYCNVPDLIAYYLGERPLLDPTPTYRCADPNERTSVLERLDKLVTKPVDSYGGGGVLIGPHASAAELQQRKQEILDQPGRWIAQETVNLSTHPTLTAEGMRPRHVDLRAFVYLTGTGEGEVAVADLGLTRVAPAKSMMVNSSRGGGAKDTWILADPPADN